MTRSLLAILTLFSAFALAGRPQYSVGIDLSLDYAVASISFPNRTTVDVATIQGNSAYRQVMHEAASSYIHRSDAPVEIRVHGHYQNPILPDQVKGWLQSSADFLCYNIPQSWLGKPSLDSTAQAFVPMLQSLKTAVEMHLGMPDSLHAASVSLPLPLTAHYRNSLLSAASSVSLSLVQPQFAGTPAGIYAAMAYGVEGTCDAQGQNCDPERLILSIDYSRAAITALLLHEDTGIMHAIRTLHDEALGVNALDGKCEQPSDQEDCLTELRHALLELTRLPLSDGSSAQDIRHISHVVLHGESAVDQRLSQVLQDILGDDTTGLAKRSGENLVDPIFAPGKDWMDDDRPASSGRMPL